MEYEFDFTQNTIVRKDLKISKGKLCSQVAHAAVLAVEKAKLQYPDWYRNWIEEGQRKVILKASSLKELNNLKKRAGQMELPYALVRDKGLTEVPPNTVTCIGIGPAPKSILNKLTRNLPLL